MITYDTNQGRPAPMVEIGVASVSSRKRRQTIKALVDTGSDITAIPQPLAAGLHLTPISRVEIEDLAAERATVLSYAVQLAVAGVVIPRLEVVLTNLDHAILGRDVLSRFYISLNGPALTLELSTAP
jgi:hypothetical protein